MHVCFIKIALHIHQNVHYFLIIDCDASTCREHLLLPEGLYAKALHSTKDLPRKENVILFWFYIIKAEGSASDRYN